MENTELEKLKKDLEEARQKNMELSSRVIELEDENSEIREDINRIRGSKLYKMSKPLRFVR